MAIPNVATHIPEFAEVFLAPRRAVHADPPATIAGAPHVRYVVTGTSIVEGTEPLLLIAFCGAGPLDVPWAPGMFHEAAVANGVSIIGWDHSAALDDLAASASMTSEQLKKHSAKPPVPLPPSDVESQRSLDDSTPPSTDEDYTPPASPSILAKGITDEELEDFPEPPELPDTPRIDAGPIVLEGFDTGKAAAEAAAAAPSRLRAKARNVADVAAATAAASALMMAGPSAQSSEAAAINPPPEAVQSLFGASVLAIADAVGAERFGVLAVGTGVGPALMTITHILEEAPNRLFGVYFGAPSGPYGPLPGLASKARSSAQARFDWKTGLKLRLFASPTLVPDSPWEPSFMTPPRADSSSPLRRRLDHSTPLIVPPEVTSTETVPEAPRPPSAALPPVTIRTTESPSGLIWGQDPTPADLLLLEEVMPGYGPRLALWGGAAAERLRSSRGGVSGSMVRWMDESLWEHGWGVLCEEDHGPPVPADLRIRALFPGQDLFRASSSLSTAYHFRLAGKATVTGLPNLSEHGVMGKVPELLLAPAVADARAAEERAEARLNRKRRSSSGRKIVASSESVHRLVSTMKQASTLFLSSQVPTDKRVLPQATEEAIAAAKEAARLAELIERGESIGRSTGGHLGTKLAVYGEDESMAPISPKDDYFLSDQ